MLQVPSAQQHVTKMFTLTYNQRNANPKQDINFTCQTGKKYKI